MSTPGNTAPLLFSIYEYNLYLSELEDEDVPDSLVISRSGDGRKLRQTVSMSPTRSSQNDRISPRTSGYSSDNIK